MVAPEPGEPLLWYIVVMAKAVSLVLVAERSKPPQPQEIKEASVNGSGSQGPKPTGSPEVGVAAGSHLPKASLAPKHQVRPDNTTGSLPRAASSGLDALEDTTT
jgi:hypothetical protein